MMSRGSVLSKVQAGGGGGGRSRAPRPLQLMRRSASLAASSRDEMDSSSKWPPRAFTSSSIVGRNFEGSAVYVVPLKGQESGPEARNKCLDTLKEVKS
ncbi:hypothetical protein E2C01_001988 [Portunus trituberculatus]|uniref:Uncharacterized protein n=1 Tax=Portunus trituberculatus TaxID=210409 RepID=A0A5B7CJC5_PORTR|nr:hypothetical protein [Portunus trituberculatus]